jgi:hypothetical protein
VPTRAPLLIGFLAVGCAGGTLLPDDGEALPALDAPAQFLVGNPSGRATLEVNPGGPCRSLMVDPRDGLRLTLVRAARGRGDYDVPSGRYGVHADALLRLECGTGRVVGVVPR